MAKLFLLFLFVPLIEIYFLIELGSVLGVGFTLFMVVFTALLGAALVRYQGITTLARAQGELLKNKMPAREVLEGALLLLAGAFLLIPGFFSDALGFFLLTPPLRQFLVQRFLKNRIQSSPMPAPDGRVIDVEYKDLD